MSKPKGESRGLAFLQSARPEATSHLLSFFRESGKHLDRKTRFLISVVTKVISQSPRGLAQYARRALEAGASPDEIVDAILCAYPCAGLTRVVDALDVLLDLGLPGFEELARGEASPSASEARDPAGATISAPPPAPPAPPRPKRWIEVARRGELSESERLRIEVDGREIAVFETAGEIFAIDNICPHKGAQLVNGHVAGDVVACSLHRWHFQLRTGACVDHPGASVRSYPVRVEGDRILLEI